MNGVKGSPISMPNRETTPLWVTGALLLLLMVSGTLVYSNTFHGPFVFDDINFITKNDPSVHMTRFSWEAIKKAALEGKPQHRYLPNISFAINYYFGAENPFGYHLFNLALHLLTGGVLFLFFRQTIVLCFRQKEDGISVGWPQPTLSPELLSFFAALIWLVHPEQTNAVTYICQRMASMTALFYVLSLLCYVKGRINYRNKRIKTGAGCFAGCFFFGCAAVASKENAGVLPVFILLYEWFFFQSLRMPRSGRSLIWLVVTGIAFGSLVLYFLGEDPLHRILASYDQREFTLPQRVMTEFRVVAYYVSLLFSPQPSRLILDHDYPLSYSFTNPSTTLTCFAMIIAITGLAVYSAKKERLISFALFWFLGNLVIESSVIGIEIIYEHRMYLPVMFLCLAATDLIFRAIKNQRAAAVFLVFLAVILSFGAHQRNQIWATDVAFWTNNVRKSPQKERPYQNLAYSLQTRGELETALVYYRKSLEIKPHPVVYFNMGVCLYEIGYYSDAVDAYIHALKMGYQTPQAHASLAESLARIGEFDAALAHFGKASRLDPADRRLVAQKAALQAFLGKCREPEQCLTVSIQQAPDIPALRFKLAMLYEKQGKAAQAFEIYDKILAEIGPSDRKLYLLVVGRMARRHAASGEMDKALALLQKAIAAVPDNSYFYYETAACYGMSGDMKNALIWLNQAIQKGFRNVAQIRSDRRLECIRNTEEFQNLLKMK